LSRLSYQVVHDPVGETFTGIIIACLPAIANSAGNPRLA
jgi:hypothetical protein